LRGAPNALLTTRVGLAIQEFSSPPAGERRISSTALPQDCRAFHYDLTYTSSQESRKYDSLWRRLAADMGEDPRVVKWAMGQIGKRHF
jgi:hypothetical protein